MNLKNKITAFFSLDDPAVNATSQQRQQAYGSLIEALYRQSAICIPAAVVNAAILLYISSGEVGPGSLFSWAGCMAAGMAFCIFAALRYRRRISGEPPARLYRLMLTSIIAIGFAWGSAVVFLIPDGVSIGHALLVVIILCGISAGALGCLAVPLSAYLGFSLPVWLAVIVRFSVFDHPLHLAIVAVTILFLILTAVIALSINRDRYRLQLMKNVFEDLVAERTSRLEAVNRELESKVHELQNAHLMLKQERDRLETITGNIGAGLAVISRDYKILWANKVLKEMFGAGIEGRTCYSNFKQRSDICPECGVTRIFDGQDKIIHEQSGRDSGGSRLWFQIIATPIKDSHGNVTAALELVLPITEKKQAEAFQERMARELEQVRKIEAIATLAGGIAHQFNNALTAVVGNIELLQLDYAHDENLSRYLEPVLESAARMTEWTRQLLAYAEGGKYRPQTVSLTGFINETLPLLRHSIGQDINLVADMDEVDCPVHIDLAQMQMVLSSIVANAAEAIDGRGTITISCKDCRQGAEHLPGMQPERYVCLSVTDNGRGMDEATRKRVFEPFFTTKFYGRGLGMAAVYGIVKNHGGYIAIDSESGKGTTVNLFLPRAREEDRPQHVTRVIAGSGRILLIEDEELVREINQALLERLGYEVVTAADGARALELVENSPEKFDLALLDIKLPDIDGAALFPRLRRHQPEMKVIVCSGYALDGPTQTILDAGAEDFIQKPFSMADIAAKIERVLRLRP